MWVQEQIIGIHRDCVNATQVLIRSSPPPHDSLMPTAGTYQAQGVGTDLDGYAGVRTGVGINLVTS